MDNLVVETIGLTKWYGRVRAVDNLSLRIPTGGVFGLLGPNGSGKTTTMCMLLSLVRPISGGMRLFGQETEGARRQALRRIGATVETPTFYPYLSGRGNLLYFQGLSHRSDPSDVDHLLDMVGLAGRAGSRFSTYSLGMKQRLGIAYALLNEPELVFLDEPTNGLDPAGMAEVRDLIRRLGTDGRTVLLSSHLLHEVEHVCDRVAILSKGRLIAQGSVRELLKEQCSVRFKTTNDAEAVPIASSLSWIESIRAENGFLVATAAPERSWEITAALAKAGIYVSEMMAQQVSLEEYFLEVTGEGANSTRQAAS